MASIVPRLQPRPEGSGRWRTVTVRDAGHTLPASFGLQDIMMRRGRNDAVCPKRNRAVRPRARPDMSRCDEHPACRIPQRS